MKASGKKAAADIVAELLGLHREDDIRSTLHRLLLAVDAGRYGLSVPAGRGEADMVCYEFRTVIETKTRGECHPQSPGVKPGETQKDQLSRYLAALASSAPASRTRTQTYWRGFLTDGEVGWGYERDEVNQEAVPMPAVSAWKVDSLERLNFAPQK